jgi:regulator of protease activity HflC (stomatin/prohibitin superfamily)
MLSFMSITDGMSPTIKGGLALIMSVFLAFKAFKFVQEGEHGVKLRFGAVKRNSAGEPAVMKPGWLFLIPFVDNLRTIHVREKYIGLASQTVILKDKTTFVADAAMNFKVTDVYKALFDINNLEEALGMKARAIFREVCDTVSIVGDDSTTFAQISEQVLEKLRPTTERWGVEVTSFQIRNFCPTTETAVFISAKTAVQTKIAALKAAEIDPKEHPELAAALIGIPVMSTVGNGK